MWPFSVCKCICALILVQSQFLGVAHTHTLTCFLLCPPLGLNTIYRFQEEIKDVGEILEEVLGA